MTIIALERFTAWTNPDGTPTDRAAEFVEELTRQINFNTLESGSGSPESVVAADPGKLYWDTAGTAGNILYIKKTGTGTTGWVLV